MTASPETLESLTAYCAGHKRVIPRNWDKLYQMLSNSGEPSEERPPRPLILAAWDVTMPLEKLLRFQEHLKWASDHDQLEVIGPYRRALPEDQWYHWGEL